MTFEEYLQQIGFKTNPFQFSNADKEADIRSTYFIKPDYFEDVWGNPYNPVPNIIYAPRGGGKTAQRIMVEKRAKDFDDVLTLTYVNHDLTQFTTIEEVSLAYHLVYLNRLLLLSFFNRIEKKSFDFLYTFNISERQYIYKIARINLYDTPASFPIKQYNLLRLLKTMPWIFGRDLRSLLLTLSGRSQRAKDWKLTFQVSHLIKNLNLVIRITFLTS